MKVQLGKMIESKVDPFVKFHISCSTSGLYIYVGNYFCSKKSINLILNFSKSNQFTVK